MCLYIIMVMIVVILITLFVAYNNFVRLNSKFEMFPSNVITKIFSYKSKNIFEVKEERQNFIV